MRRTDDDLHVPYKRSAVLLSLIFLGATFSFFESTDAVTLDDASTYKRELQIVYEEVSLRIEPGTRLSKEERDRKIVDNAKFQMRVYHDDPAAYLKYWLRFYHEMSDRLSRDIRVKDPTLSLWHARLLSGAQDCRSLTSLALDIMTRRKPFDIENALSDADLASGIHENAEYFHALESDLKQILFPLFPNERELRTFIRDMPIHFYIERTWK